MPIRNMFQYQIVSSTQNAVPNLTSGNHGAGTPLARPAPPANVSTKQANVSQANEVDRSVIVVSVARLRWHSQPKTNAVPKPISGTSCGMSDLSGVGMAVPGFHSGTASAAAAR